MEAEAVRLWQQELPAAVHIARAEGSRELTLDTKAGIEHPYPP